MFNQEMKSTIKKSSFRFVIGWLSAIIIAVVFSSFVVLIYNYSGMHIANKTGSTDYKWSPGQYKANATEGINYMHMDSNGFNNVLSDTDGIDLLLMGGSHMEAVQIKTEFNTGSLLNEMIPEKYTYNIGMSGHQFLNCLDNLEAALAEFVPSEYVIIQTGDLSMKLNDIVAVKDHKLGDIPSYDSGIVYYMQKIPAIKVLYKQLSDKLSQDIKSNKATTGGKSESDRSSVSLVLRDVLSEKKALCDQNKCGLIIAYTPPVIITASGKMERNDDLEWVNTVKQCCEDSGIVFLDSFDDFEKEYINGYVVPYGFDNSKIATGHLNRDGHRILASVIAEYIEGESR